MLLNTGIIRVSIFCQQNFLAEDETRRNGRPSRRKLACFNNKHVKFHVLNQFAKHYVNEISFPQNRQQTKFRFGKKSFREKSNRNFLGKLQNNKKKKFSFAVTENRRNLFESLCETKRNRSCVTNPREAKK
jgi:hypothetical protein